MEPKYKPIKPTQSSLLKNKEPTTQKSDLKKSEPATNRLIAVIRIGGEVKKKSDIVETLNRLRLQRKYTCTLINPNNPSLMGMLNEVKYYVAFGEIEKDVLVKLITKRGQLIKIPNKKYSEKIDIEKISDELMKGKKLNDFGIKPFFRLHPPRGGIKSKLQYPKGVLGNNKDDINKLIERML
ncbi:MAG: uL30 family ribosomal protein [Candidatus Nanoarchaeia archaeon]|nr:uL30 family ribosomal protein [Candidatus Nanoarchaeia archaeon]